MRIKISILFFFVYGIIIAQNPQIKTELPTIIPPSPTVAALMKFEEVPVSNYVGIPDISIPLFSSSTLSKDINFNLELKYHVNNIKPENVAGDTGLGWSLLAGGTITRTVRGLPDEIYDTQDYYTGKGKIGLYHTEGTYKNKYHKVFDYLINGNNSQISQYDLNEYFFDNTEKNKMDSQYDLWQFNFLGKTGRFLIIKDVNNNVLTIKNLDLSNKISINLNYNTTTFIINSFEVFDDKGYKYIFDVIETTLNSTTVTSESFVPGSGVISNLDEDKLFNSSFHLSKILSPNNQKIIEFKYSETSNIEFTTSNTEEYSEPINSIESMSLYDYISYKNSNCPGSVNSLGPKFQSIVQQTKVFTKKLSTIDVINTAKIVFNFQFGRSDSKLINGQNSMFLNEIFIKDWKDSFVKKIKLNYNYKNSMYSRLNLESIEFQNNSQVSNEKYSFQYKELPSSYNGETFTKDNFGYLTIIPSNIQNYYYKDVNPDYVSTDALQKITYPSKGSVVFDFQSNTYSYEGNNLLTSFDDNIKNWVELSQTAIFSNLTSTYKDLFTLNQSQNVYLNSTLNYDASQNNSISDFRFVIYKFENNTYTNVGGIDESTCPDGNCSITLNNLSPGVYKVKFSSVDLNFPNTFTASITANFKQKNNNYQYNFGGGVRINKIGYYKTNVNKNIFNEINPIQAEKLLNYDYSNGNLSNGALVSIKPKFEYEYKLQKIHDFSGCISNGCPKELTPIFSLKKFTTYNNIKGIQTQGSDIGYSIVKVIENSKGYIKYEYKSPIDYPETRNDFYPFMPSENFDFKRGLLKKQTTYNQSNKILFETTFDYEIEEASENMTIYGINFYVPNYANNGLFYNPTSLYSGTYNEYLNYALNPSEICPYGLSAQYLSPIDYVSFSTLKEAYGWSKLKIKNTKEYVYPYGSNIPNIIETNETYTYNSVNKQIASESSTNSLGENITTNYYYHSGNSIYSQNRISEIERIETLKAGQLVSENKIIYNNTWPNNVSFLPQTIESKKGTTTSEIKVRYTNYDEFGNIRELQQENGTFVSYIWGYNKTQPIAKIENATYAQVQSYEANLQTLSNATDENSLITALNALRSNLPNAMVTTFTHKPLIGVSTITDPKGLTTTYIYDAFNRLQQVKDHQGNILSQNQYNYRPQ